jgi:hypothetical protein
MSIMGPVAPCIIVLPASGATPPTSLMTLTTTPSIRPGTTFGWSQHKHPINQGRHPCCCARAFAMDHSSVITSATATASATATNPSSSAAFAATLVHPS